MNLQIQGAVGRLRSQLGTITLILLIYFLCMDLLLYGTIQDFKLVALNNETIVNVSPKSWSPFDGLTIKTIMVDHLNHYVWKPMSWILITRWPFSVIPSYINPNTISISGLLFSIAAAKCVASEHPGSNQLCALFMFCRGWMDALDGIVARSSPCKADNGLGAWVDTISDSVGCMIFLAGCAVYLKRSTTKNWLPLTQTIHSKTGWIYFIVAGFYLQTVLIGFFIDYFREAFHVLLEERKPYLYQTMAQSELLKSWTMWVIIWLWKLTNSLSNLNFLVIAIFFNKIQTFFVWIQLFGFIAVILLASFSKYYEDFGQTYIDVAR